MEGWKNGWMDELIHHPFIFILIFGWMMDKWMGRWMSESIYMELGGWMNGWMNR